MEKNYYSKKYEINPKIRAMIESKIGKKFDLSYVQIENIVGRVYKGEYKSLLSPFTSEDKRKVISYLKETSPNKFDDEVCETVNRFLKDNFTTSEIKSYLDYCINKYYNPGRKYKGISVNNDGIINLIVLSQLYNTKDGIIVNKKDANDIVNYFGIEQENIKFKYDSNLIILDKDFTSELIEKYNEIKLDYGIEYYMNDDIFIIVSNDEKSTLYLKEQFVGLKFEKILDFNYYDKQDDEVSDTMDLGNGMVMKGNFTKLGKVGGTEIIGVGSSTGNKVLDGLIKDDAMDMINRIMKGDMSRCGKGDDGYGEGKTPKDYYFSVCVSESGDDLDPSGVCLVGVDFYNKNKFLDDSLVSNSLDPFVLVGLDNAGVCSNSELMEGVWEVLDYSRDEQDIIDAMISEGFIYNPSINK